MAYTSKQLTMAWTAVHNGIAPDAETQATLDAFTAPGTSDEAALGFILNSGDDTTALAALSYQFFTGKAPTKAGMDYLTNSATNPNDLSDPYYAKFNIENRYISFAANLGVQGEGAADFAAKYGAMSFETYVASIYETIIGATYAKAAGVDVAAAIAYLVGTKDALLTTAKSAGMVTDDMTPAQVDLALKAAMAGLVMAASIKSDIGVYAASANNFMIDLAQDKAVYGADLVQDYGPASGKGSDGTGTTVNDAPAGADMPGAPAQPPVRPPAVAHAFTLTGAADRFSGDRLADTFTATDTTLTAGDALDGKGGNDTLTITGAGFTAPSLTVRNIETVNVTASSSTSLDTQNWAGLKNLNVTAIRDISVYASDDTDVVIDNTDLQYGDIVARGHNVTVTAVGAILGAHMIEATGAVVVDIEAMPITPAISSSITVTGGTTIDITQRATNPVNDLYQSAGPVAVYGGRATTSVKVAGPKPQDPDPTHAGHAGGDLMVMDVNASAARAGTIASLETDGVQSIDFHGTALASLKLINAVQALVTIDNDGPAPQAATLLDLRTDSVDAIDLRDQGVYETLNLEMTGPATSLSARMAALETLNVTGAGSLQLDASGSTALTKVTVGAGASLGGQLENLSHLDLVDASQSTLVNFVSVDASHTALKTGSAGDFVILHSATVDRDTSTGAGDDFVLSAADAGGINATIDGGAGTADTVLVSIDTAVAASATLSAANAFASHVTNFERLLLNTEIGGSGGVSGTVDLDWLGGYHFVGALDGDGLVLKGLDSGDTLNLMTDGVSYLVDSANFGGAGDSLNLILGEDTLLGFQTSDLHAGEVSIQGVESLAITNIDDGGALRDYSVTIDDDDLTTITVDGDAGMILTADSQVINSIDASGLTQGGFEWTSGILTGNVTVQGSATGHNVVDMTAAMFANVTYTGGSGDDDLTLGGDGGFIDLGEGDNTFHGGYSARLHSGSGDDTITINNSSGQIHVGGGDDTIVYAYAGMGFSADEIHDMDADDKIGFGFAVGTGTLGAAADVSAYTTSGVVDTTTAVIAQFAGDGAAGPIIHWFTADGNAYLTVDNADGAYSNNSANGYTIVLVGVTDLSGATLSGNTITLH